MSPYLQLIFFSHCPSTSFTLCVVFINVKSKIGFFFSVPSDILGHYVTIWSYYSRFCVTSKRNFLLIFLLIFVLEKKAVDFCRKLEIDIINTKQLLVCTNDISVKRETCPHLLSTEFQLNMFLTIIFLNLRCIFSLISLLLHFPEFFALNKATACSSMAVVNFSQIIFF